MAIKHIMQDVNGICSMWTFTIILEKCCVHNPHSLNDWNYFILQLLQVLLVCHGVLHKDQSSKLLLPDCKVHDAFCRME